MWEKMSQVSGNSILVVDSEKVLKACQEPMTSQSLGIELSKDKPFTKADFERDLKKATRKIKK